MNAMRSRDALVLVAVMMLLVCGHSVPAGALAAAAHSRAHSHGTPHEEPHPHTLASIQSHDDHTPPSAPGSTHEPMAPALAALPLPPALPSHGSDAAKHATADSADHAAHDTPHRATPEDAEALRALEREEAELDAQIAAADKAAAESGHKAAPLTHPPPSTHHDGHADEDSADHASDIDQSHSTHEIAADMNHEPAAAAEGAHRGPTGPHDRAMLRESARAMLRRLARERAKNAKKGSHPATDPRRTHHRFTQTPRATRKPISLAAPDGPVQDLYPVDHSQDDLPDDDRNRDASLLKFAMEQMLHASNQHQQEISQLLAALKEDHVAGKGDAAAASSHDGSAAPSVPDVAVAVATNYTIWILVAILLLVLCVAVPLVWLLWIKQLMVSPPDGRYPSSARPSANGVPGKRNPHFYAASLNGGGGVGADDAAEHEQLVLDEEYPSSGGDEEEDGVFVGEGEDDMDPRVPAFSSVRTTHASGGRKTKNGRGLSSGKKKKKPSAVGRASAAAYGGHAAVPARPQPARAIPVTAAATLAARTLDKDEDDEDVSALTAILTPGNAR